MIGRALFALLLLACALLPEPAGAKPCGDDVGGRDVPCACGDTVVSGLVLGSDPVTTATCPADGLVVRASAMPAGVTIDLNAKTLRGRGAGAGLWIVDGGPGGARVVSSGGPATIEGFRDGLVALEPGGVALIDGLRVTTSARDGMRVRGDGFEMRNAEAHESGRDGIALVGSGFRVTATRARRSRRFGYFVMGQGAVLGASGAGNAVEGSGAHGVNLMGTGHRLIEATATGAGKDGLHLAGTRLEIRGCVAAANAGHGIVGSGMDWRLAGNQARDNGRNGIFIGGQGAQDLGGNAGSGNHGVQCEIAGSPCLP
jgi:hypothetical protein